MADSTAFHEAAHAVAARALGVPVTYVSIRPHEDDAGRVKFDTASEGFQDLDLFDCAIVKVAGEVGERMLEGETSPRFNWFADGGDAEDARHFISQLGGDEADTRHWATVRAYALLRTRWDQVEAVAAKLERSTTLLGGEVEQVCKRLELRKKGWTDAEIRAGSRKLSRAEALARMTPQGRRALAGTLAADGTTVVLTR